MFDKQKKLFDEEQKKPMTWRERYNIVIRSKYWKSLRQKRLKQCNYSCEHCGWKNQGYDKSRTLDLHHKTYKRLGSEHEEDIEVLCSLCHEKADRQRAETGKRKSKNAIRNAQFYGWVSKVYGEGFEPDEDAWERFLDWKDSQ